MTMLGGTLPQWITSASVLTLLVGALTVYIKGWPERARAKNEARVIDNTEAAVIRAEFAALNKQARDDIHKLRNELQVVTAEQIKCGRDLAEAQAETLSYKTDMGTLLFLIRLLISEIKRLDPDPTNIIIAQAEMTVEELARKRGVPPPASSLEAAAEKTVECAQDTLDEVKAGGAA